MNVLTLQKSNGRKVSEDIQRTKKNNLKRKKEEPTEE